MNLKDSFNEAAKNYDSLRKKLIPCFQDFYQTVLDLIPFDQDKAIRVLDLGAGTGLLSEIILKSFDKAQLTLIDLADEMLNVA